MERLKHPGLVLRHLRKTQGLSLQQAAEKLNRSAGWLSEVENSRGRSTIDREEFERVIGLLNGDKHRDMFRTWISNQLNLERVDRTFDGAVLKHVRLKQELRLKEAAKKLGMSSSYLCKLEAGRKPICHEMRQSMMKAYGYSPSSFKNLSTDPIRSKAVPPLFKLKILLGDMSEHQIESIYHFVRSLISENENAEIIPLENNKTKSAVAGKKSS